MKDFTASMNGITAKVDEYTKDESPFAYKNIFEVMDLQKDLLEVVHHLKPLINIKG
jgi:tRNA-splicing ligase RtcB (3'-phosphate/5'-hydroxy nucleic acid ligase)